MRKIITEGPSGNILATIAIGSQYIDDWETYALKNWENYCLKHELGLIVVDQDLIDKDDPLWKKATWQKMLLGECISKSYPSVKNVCYLDTDILINPFAPNIFDFHLENCISIVSQIKNLPFPLHETLRRIAFYRHNFYSKDYPLDSALFMKPEKIFESMGEEKFNDYTCAGMFVFNVKKHKNVMKSWFEKYTKFTETLTMGDEPAFNVEVLKWGNVNWLPYKFQALWNYEMAWKYPFLYNRKINDKSIQKECIQTSLMTNFFLHFAGSWFESEMWKENDLLDDSWMENCNAYFKYLDLNVSGTPKGLIRPK